MKPKKADIGFLRDAFAIRRFHTIGHVNMVETVGHHTAGVIAILFFLYDDDPPVGMIKLALHHDAAELATGDIPATAKWRHPDLAKAATKAEEAVAEEVGLMNPVLNEQEAALFKFADMMDLCFKSVEELATGNEMFLQVLYNGLEYCGGLLKGPLKGHEAAHELYVRLKCNRFINIQEVQNERNQQVLQ